jgi:hypothetical protein
MSAIYLSARYGKTETTARLFMHKIREAMDGQIHVDEFVVGGKDEGKTGRSYDSKKTKAVIALQLPDDSKVKRIYAMKIEDL